MGLDTWLTPMGPYPLVEEVGMVLAFTTFILSLRKGRHKEHLQWKSMRKGPRAWDNLYGSRSLVMGDKIYEWDGSILKATACTTRGPWFGKFMRGTKFSMGVIKKQDFGITYQVVKCLLESW